MDIHLSTIVPTFTHLSLLAFAKAPRKADLIYKGDSDEALHPKTTEIHSVFHAPQCRVPKDVTTQCTPAGVEMYGVAKKDAAEESFPDGQVVGQTEYDSLIEGK